MKTIFIIDDDAHFCRAIEDAAVRMGNDGFCFQAVNPMGKDKPDAERLRNIIAGGEGLAAIIDLQWRKSDEHRPKFHALQVISALIDGLDLPSKPMPTYLLSGYDWNVGKGGGGTSKMLARWHDKLSDYFDVRGVLMKPIPTDGVLTLGRKLFEEPHALRRVVEAMPGPTRLIAEDGTPFFSNRAWSWSVSWPAFQRPADPDESGRVAPGLEDFLANAASGAERGKHQAYQLYTSEQLSDDGNKFWLQYAIPVEGQVTEIDGNLRAIALLAGSLGFSRVRYYERIRLANTELKRALGGAENPAKDSLSVRGDTFLARLRAHFATPEPGIVDQAPILPDREPDKEDFWFIDEIDLPDRHTERLLSFPIIDDVLVGVIRDDLEERPADLDFKARDVTEEKSTIISADGRRLLDFWNRVIELHENAVWAEIPIYARRWTPQRENDAKLDTEGWLVFEAPEIFADGSHATKEEVERRIEQRDQTLIQFCSSLARAIELDREALYQDLREEITSFFRAERKFLFKEPAKADGATATREFFNRLVEKTRDWLGADIAALARLPSPESTPVLEALNASPVAEDTITPEWREPGATIDARGYPALTEAMRIGRLYANLDMAPPAGAKRNTARMGFPIIFSGRMIGALAVVSFQRYRFDEFRATVLRRIVREGMLVMQTHLEKQDRFAWEAALIHEINRLTVLTRKGMREAVKDLPHETPARIELENAQAGFLELELLVEAFRVIRDPSQIKSKSSVFDAAVLLPLEFELPSRRITEADGSRQPKDGCTPSIRRIFFTVESADPRCYGLEAAFVFAFRILLSNAVEHGSLGVDIDVRVLDHPNDEGMLRIEIVNGGQIPTEVMNSMFEPFVRSPSAGPRGLHIGLAAARTWVERNGARLQVSNEDCERIVARLDWPRPTEDRK